jgi:hypothetical protein
MALDPEQQAQFEQTQDVPYAPYQVDAAILNDYIYRADFSGVVIPYGVTRPVIQRTWNLLIRSEGAEIDKAKGLYLVGTETDGTYLSYIQTKQDQKMRKMISARRLVDGLISEEMAKTPGIYQSHYGCLAIFAGEYAVAKMPDKVEEVGTAIARDLWKNPKFGTYAPLSSVRRPYML